MNKLIYAIAFLSSTLISAQQYISGSVYGGSGITTVYDNFHNSSNDLFAVGFYNTAFSFAGTTIGPVGGNQDGYLIKYDSSGNELQTFVFGNSDDALCIAGAVDNSDNIYITGNFSGAGTLSLDADPGPDVHLLGNLSAIKSRDCFIVKLDNLGNFLWAKQVSNTLGAAPEDPSDIAVDSQGNVYVTGRFIQADFDPSDNQNVILTPGNTFNAFLLKLDSEGNYQWVRTLPNGVSRGQGIGIDSNDNVYFTGNFTGTINVDPANTANTLTSNGLTDAFIVSYDTNGNYLSSASFGGIGNDEGKCIVMTDTGYSVAGTFTETVDLNPGTLEESYTSQGLSDVFISHFDTANEYQSTYVFGGTGIDNVNDLTKDDAGNLYAAGGYSSSVDFDNSANTAITTVISEGQDVYTLIISPSNTYILHGVNNSPVDTGGGATEVIGDYIATQAFFKGSIDLDPYVGSDIVPTGSNYQCFTSIFTLTNLGIEDIDNQNDKINIYPNPAKDFIQINSEDFNQYKIFNTEGKLVKFGNLMNTNIIDVQSLKAGLYMIQLNNQNRTETLKFLKK